MPSRVDDEFEHQNHLRCTHDALLVDFSEKLNFNQSCSKCFQAVFKYSDYDNDYKNTYHNVPRVSKVIFEKTQIDPLTLNTPWYGIRITDFVIINHQH